MKVIYILICFMLFQLEIWKCTTFFSFIKFIGCDLPFKRLVLIHNIQQNFGSCQIIFFPLPLYPTWVLGVWVINIQTIKTLLHKVAGWGEIDYFTLLTIISNIQKTVNSYPQESAERKVVTPNMFFNENDLLNLNDGGFVESMPGEI